MTTTTAMIVKALATADSIAWDGCHKIYVLLDTEQTAQMTAYGYRENDEGGPSRLYRKDEMPAEVMLATLREWWEDSCGLRFISAVTTNHADPNAGFTPLIPQCEEWH